jgi:hypothetical protein
MSIASPAHAHADQQTEQLIKLLGEVKIAVENLNQTLKSAASKVRCGLISLISCLPGRATV